MSEFAAEVIRLIRMIPAGRVATYKQIVALAGKPHASRGVAWILHSCSTSHRLPWHRVLNSQGRISFDRKSHNFREQKKRLLRERVAVTPDGRLDLAKVQWKRRAGKRRSLQNQPKIFQD